MTLLFFIGSSAVERIEAKKKKRETQRLSSAATDKVRKLGACHPSFFLEGYRWMYLFEYRREGRRRRKRKMKRKRKGVLSSHSAGNDRVFDVCLSQKRSDREKSRQPVVRGDAPAEWRMEGVPVSRSWGKRKPDLFFSLSLFLLYQRRRVVNRERSSTMTLIGERASIQTAFNLIGKIEISFTTKKITSHTHAIMTYQYPVSLCFLSSNSHTNPSPPV